MYYYTIDKTMKNPYNNYPKIIQKIIQKNSLNLASVFSDYFL